MLVKTFAIYPYHLEKADFRLEMPTSPRTKMSSGLLLEHRLLPGPHFYRYEPLSLL